MKTMQYFKDRISLLGLRLIAKKRVSSFQFFLDHYEERDLGKPETFFICNDHRRIPVFPNYRYSVKPGWTNFRGLNILSHLKALNEITSGESEFLDRAKGSRALRIDPVEIDSVASLAVERNQKYFLIGEGSGLPEFIPRPELLRNAIKIYRDRHDSMFKKLSALGVYQIPSKAKILEIGFISGGYSIYAFEQMGFRASGIDNHYGGLVDRPMLHQYVKEKLRSNANLIHGDITTVTDFAPGSFDVIYSVSVLEHIKDLPAAFAEMHRLLKPGGVIIHNYAPYFSHDGGHALGIGDCPWAHVRLGENEYFRYLEELRPKEAKVAVNWIKGALNRDTPQWRMQRIIINAGFDISLWVAKPSPKPFVSDLSPHIIRECFTNNPDICIEDLMSQSVSFVATK